MKRADFPQYVLDRADAAYEMAYEDGGEPAAEMAYAAALEKWALKHGKKATPRTLHSGLKGR